MNTNEPITESISENTEQKTEGKETLIGSNETDIEPISRQASIEDLPKGSCPGTAAEEEADHLEKPIPKKKPRTQKQIEAFRKAQEALKTKRLIRKQEKESQPKPKRGRPKKILPTVKKKIEEEEEEDEEEDEDEEDFDEQVFITTRRKSSLASKKPKMKPKRRIVYVSESESESESESDSDSEQYLQYPSSAPPPMSPFDGLRFL